MRDYQPKSDSQPTHQPLESSDYQQPDYQQPDYQQPEEELLPKGNLSSRRIPLGLLAGISAVIVLTGSATAWWTWNFAARNADPSKPAPATVQPSPVDPPATNVPIESPAAQAPEPQPSSPAEEQTAEVYWLDINAEQLELVARPISLTTDQPNEALKVVFENLLQGPSESAAFSEIPEGTELREVTVESDGVHVDLSEDFTIGGGSASMMGRLGQIVYTATSLEPETNVWISVEGEPLEVLGGEGLIVDQPMTRDDFEQNFAL